jgi:hypothetical protein
MWQRRMAAFLRGKGQILWDVTVNSAYVHPVNFLAPGSRDMHDANNKCFGLRGSSDRRNALDCANPTLEQMAQHRFYSFGTNSSAEIFVQSCARF